MERVKLVLRIVIAIVIGIPTLWILYLVFSVFGLALWLPFIGLIGIPFNWLTGDKDGLKESFELVKIGGMLLIAPFAFWRYFIIGKNPFKEMGM